MKFFNFTSALAFALSMALWTSGCGAGNGKNKHPTDPLEDITPLWTNITYYNNGAQMSLPPPFSTTQVFTVDSGSGSCSGGSGPTSCPRSVTGSAAASTWLGRGRDPLAYRRERVGDRGAHRSRSTARGRSGLRTSCPLRPSLIDPPRGRAGRRRGRPRCRR